MGADDNLSVLQRLVDAINDKTFSSILPDYIAADFVRHDHASLWEGVEGQTGASDFLGMLVRAMPDFHIEAEKAFASEDHAAVVWKMTGTHSGSGLLNAAPTDKRIEFRTVNLYRFADGKIAETWQMPDAAGLRRQVGLTS